MNFLSRIASAFAFLTILPMPRALLDDSDALKRGRAWFPLVGLFLGAVFFGVAWCAAYLNAPVAAVLVLCAGAWLTRALHLDGLADTFDALGGGRDREHALSIMRDSQNGSFGVTALVLLLLLKFVAIWQIIAGYSESHRYILLFPLIAFPVCGRWIMAWLIQCFPYARQRGKGSAFQAGRLVPDTIIAGLITLLAAGALMGIAGIAALLVITILANLFGMLLNRKLGGLTGDIYGAFGEISEAVFLIIFINAKWIAPLYLLIFK